MRRQRRQRKLEYPDIVFDKNAVLAAVSRLNNVLAGGPREGLDLTHVLSKAKDKADEAALRMAFTLVHALTDSGKGLSGVSCVLYKRLDQHRHKIEIR